jgi:molecular chaperone GrpE
MSQDNKKPDTADAPSAAAPEEGAPEPAEILKIAPEEGVAEAEEGADEDAAEAAEEDTVGALEAEVAALNDKLLRAVAETENLRRRAAREREDTGKYAVTGFAREMLAVVDNLRRALDSLPDRPISGDAVGDSADDSGGEARQDDSLAGLVAGIEMTERELLAVFERQGIRRIEPMGEKFDPNFHQAMFEVEESSQPAGTVVQVMQAGYVIADRLLRPALVGVAKAAKDETGAKDVEDDAKDAAAHIDTEA